MARALSHLALAAAVLGVLTAAALTSWIISRLTHQQNGFERSVKALMHYTEYFDYIYAYFATVLLLIGVTLFIEPSDVGRFVRTHVFVPALEIAEHMCCLALGVFVAQRLAEFTGLLVASEHARPPFVGAFLTIFGGALTAGFAAEFLRNDLNNTLNRLGRFRIVVTVFVAVVVVLVSLNDMVWNFKPTPVLLR